MEDTKELFLLDGSSLLHRAFYALPDSLQTSDGEYTNGVFGFTKMLLRLIEEEDPDSLAVAFDLAGPTFRHEEYEEYKANRKETPDKLKPQFGLMKEVLEAFKIPVLELEGYEADDIVGTLSRQAEDEDYQVTIVTGDRDALQLVTENVKIRYTKRGITNIVDYDLEKIREEYELEPKKLIDKKGLMGDKSDNIPGVDGIGKKTSTKLLHQFGSLEEVLNNIDQVSGKKRKQTLKEQADRARMSKKLATIKLDIPLECDLDEFKLEEPDQDKLVDILSRLEFNSLLKEFGGHETLNFTDEFEIITDLTAIDELLSMLNEAEKVGFKFKFTSTELYQQQIEGLTLANNETAYYIDASELEIAELIDRLKPYFEDPELNKLCLNTKENLIYLKEQGVEVKGLSFDLLLADYLLHPSAKEQDLESVLTDQLQMELEEVESEIEAEVQQVRVLFKLEKELIDKLENKDLMELFVEVELPLISILAQMELNGIAVDKDMLQELSDKLKEKLDSIRSQAYELAGEEFNLNSPKQLGKILFEKLGLPVIKRTKTGYSTSASVLEKLEDKHEIVPLILEYRKYQKLKSTYVDPLPDLINPKTDRIHTSFNQLVTATGRLSSTDPNLQNIPIRTEEGREIRKVFIAEEGKELLAIDYSQIELRVLAHISQDENLMNAYMEGQDIHTKTAAEVFGVEASEVSYEQRRRAKAINFGIAYGISPWGLAKDINVSKKEAEDYIDQYLNRYPKVKEYMDRQIKQAKEEGYVTTILNRRRYLPEINSSNYHRRSFGERMAINTPIQGSAADIMKLAMLKSAQVLDERELDAKILLQVHDELIFEVPPEELEEVQQVVKSEMEDVIQLDVPLKVDLKVGTNWRDMDEIE
ncbi:DNA polymerase I [Sporohalobacter salinus]|uniref:DNA polymerase I n=1 Tax=Sporohalobacter salinus TaxID=1494606 RepID=UPI0019610A77|nr:DNA polymerase I [Sporohalobacter salinus]MBM7624625.1 DNA polymerase-1 [Sporohalobacter salinus]